MSDSVQITVRGRVGTDPELLVTANGRQMTRFRLGSTRSYRDAAGEWREDPTEWFTVKVWGAPGDQVRQSVHRGMPVIVQGRLSSEEWTSGERVNHTNVITAGVIAVDVKYGLVTYSKVTRLGGESDRIEDGSQPGAPDAARADDPAGGGPAAMPDTPAEEELAPPSGEPVLAPPPVEQDPWERVEVDA